MKNENPNLDQIELALHRTSNTLNSCGGCLIAMGGGIVALVLLLFLVGIASGQT